jgi:predicted NACHT family NTPase
MLNYIIIILKIFRDIQQFTTINWNTIYKYFIKLQKYNIINNYLKELQKPSKFLLSDTCLISNKLFKIMKISIITNNY